LLRYLKWGAAFFILLVAIFSYYGMRVTNDPVSADELNSKKAAGAKIVDAIEQYKKDHGKYPDSLIGLGSPYAEALPDSFPGPLIKHSTQYPTWGYRKWKDKDEEKFMLGFYIVSTRYKNPKQFIWRSGSGGWSEDGL
jgi:hypothetical protein